MCIALIQEAAQFQALLQGFEPSLLDGVQTAFKIKQLNEADEQLTHYKE